MPSLFAIMGIGPPEMIVLGVIAVLLFGNRLPSVMRSLGQGMVEFKKGLRGMEEEIESAARTNTRHVAYEDDLDDRETVSAPKFEPPTSEPKAESSAENSTANA